MLNFFLIDSTNRLVRFFNIPYSTNFTTLFIQCAITIINEMNMTIEELKAELIRIANSGGDEEMCHGDADDLIINFLAQLDPEIKTIFDSIDKWYA